MIADPVGAALLLAAPLGILGVFALALGDRLIPILPSSGLFAAIGIAAAEGWWCLSTATAASILGSATGALGTYQLGFVAGAGSAPRVRAVLKRRDRIGAVLRTTRRRVVALPFAAQLFPASRTLAPLLAGLARRDRARYLLATLAGLAIWNAGFIALGYVVSRSGSPANATLIGLGFAAGALCLGLIARYVRPHRAPASTKPFTPARVRK
ncbi:membrane protein DedA, SNARE-associated domain [Sphingomonas guangdongensis]|uniref:Membrane protein DedA, SNARE-associated domain n=1 Tax=Sphingomonas guangdongensis TaxID=1141890 RepID=A0A285QZQ7_9SPHN|nr:VTT domain-containing protein [Sphingomonas guangdongensis]SOB87373.1 membrane protein DedA, SNARE-associated domain [Sphingomonas guangdongensis]